MAICRKSFLSGALGGLVGSVFIFASLYFSDRARENPQPAENDLKNPSSTQSLFVYKGQTIRAQQLSSELKTQYERAWLTRNTVRRDSELQFYKEVDKIARVHILENQLAIASKNQQKNKQELELELLPREEATTDDARLLYEASDPSAPREGFAPVKNQLVSYLNEVRRREALEAWTNDLQKKGEWKLLVNRPEPLPELSAVNLQGLPADGKSEPNALVFVDYLCSECSPFLVEFAKQVGDHGGFLRPVYVPFPYTRPEVSMSIARASLCAQQLGGFSAFHMAALTKGELLPEVSVFELARQAGLKMGDFKACYRSGEGLADLLARAQGLARQFGLMKTPAVVIAGRLLEGDEIFKQLEPLLKSEAAAGQLTKRSTDNKRRGSSQP